MPRAWMIHSYHGHQGLSLEGMPDEAPGPSKIRLRVGAFALNRGDQDLMHDRYSFSFSAFPACKGMEAASMVDANGPGVTGIEFGMRMCTLPHSYDRRGASTEQLIIDQRCVTPAPAGLSGVERPTARSSSRPGRRSLQFPVPAGHGVGPPSLKPSDADASTLLQPRTPRSRRCPMAMFLGVHQHGGLPHPSTPGCTSTLPPWCSRNRG